MKAIKDLTQEEVNNIHKKHYDYYEGCVNCPLYDLYFIYDCKEFEREMKRHKKLLNKKIKVEQEQ